jgi:hypothetical protein
MKTDFNINPESFFQEFDETSGYSAFDDQDEPEPEPESHIFTIDEVYQKFCELFNI